MEQKNLKKFFFKPSGSMLAYCSHCGKMIKQDEYNMKKHGENCGFDASDIFEVLNGKSLGYNLEKETQDTLKLTVYVPYLNLRPGFKDRYSGGDWRPVYHARFRWNSRQVEEEGENNIAVWLHMISKRIVKYLGNRPVGEVIGDVFPVIPFIHSLGMFYHIYENKGYHVIPYEPAEAVKNAYGQPRPLELHTVKYAPFWIDKHIFGDLVEDQGKKLLAVRYYKVMEESEIVCYSFFIGEKILWTSVPFLQRMEVCSDLWNHSLKCYMNSQVLEEFHKACPAFGLGQYLDGNGKNILIPLLASGNYHKGIELLVKSGMGWYTDNYFQKNLFSQEPFPWEYQTVPELLELPKALLKEKHPEYFVSQDTRQRVRYIYKNNRSLIEGIPLTMNVLRFMKEQDITHDRSVRGGNIGGLENISDQEMRRILKYLSKLSLHRYEEYRDYLQLVHDTNNHSFGYCPTSLHTAHDELARELWLREEGEADEDFRKVVEGYRYLETLEEEEKEEASKMKSDHYLVRCPRSVPDLNQEGRNQRNCVATYRDWIIKGRSKVLFMREKMTPNKSLVTIEVQGRRLIQAKAFANQKASEDCQKFICEWCDFNGISYKNCSDITLKVS